MSHPWKLSRSGLDRALNQLTELKMPLQTAKGYLNSSASLAFSGKSFYFTYLISIKKSYVTLKILWLLDQRKICPDGMKKIES